jgi:hypothetical protein
MQKFAASIVIFIILTVILFFASNYAMEKTISNSSVFNLKNKPSYLFIGHSHTAHAYNDSLIENSLNFSSLAEPYLYEYFKLKYITKKNKSIKYVFIEVSNNQTIKYSDSWITDKSYISLHYPKKSSIMSFSEKYDLYKLNKEGFYDAFIINYQTNLLNIAQNKPITKTYFGGYYPSSLKKVDSILQYTNVDSSLLAEQKKEYEISTLNLNYLKKCITYCENNGIKIFFIRTPVHRKSPEIGNEKAFKNHLSTLSQNVEFLDFNNFIIPNDHYRDLTHLNTKGATVYSKWFNNLLNHGLTSSVNKQEFIDSCIKKFNSNNNFYK